MNRAQVGAKLLKAVFQNKWLSVEYKNKRGEISKYWIGVRDIDAGRGLFSCEGFHVTQHTIAGMTGLSFASILSAEVLEESWYETPETLKEKLRAYPEQFQKLFGYTPDLNILDYLCECARLNTAPYQSEYSLLEKFDADCLKNGICELSDAQFDKLVAGFQSDVKNKNVWRTTRHLCVNILSIYSKRGLYVLAYKSLLLDVKRRTLVWDGTLTVCKQFKVGNREEESVRRYLDNDELELLDDFEANKEQIKNAVAKHLRFPAEKVDDLPYLMPISRDVPLNLENEFAFIKERMREGNAEEPLKAFFGELTKPHIRRKKYPLALFTDKVNLDQLLAIHNAVKYPLSYIQGPPGTGKTTTILNTILTAFFNDKTVLFSSFNNHPIDGVCAALENISYRGKKVPFPVFRIGRKDITLRSLNFWRDRYSELSGIPIYSETLERDKEKEKSRSDALTELLKRYEEKVDLEERKNAIERMIGINDNMTYRFELEGRQLHEVRQRIEEIGEIKNEDALALVYSNHDELMKYIYYTSVKFIKRLGQNENADLLDILMCEDDEEKLKRFNTFLRDSENIARLAKIFPVVAGTCISCGKLGTPSVCFDMTILDEAGQCDTAYSLVPILRGRQLMLVGDPQQLSPVILLDSRTNEILKSMYRVPNEYDYISNSVYKVFLAADSVSREILLSHHYRCAPEIISFNNEKYYNGLLKIESKSADKFPLAFYEVRENDVFDKNVAPGEAREVVKYAEMNQDKSIGIITPFVKQNTMIDELVKERGLKNVNCGTVHAFQGDEKDVVLFSLALTDKTPARTYEWLKDNKELINVATSRAKSRLVVFGNEKEIDRLHDLSQSQNKNQSQTKCERTAQNQIDDVFDLKNYIKSNGTYRVTPHEVTSRALGVKPFSTETEEEFLATLSHALENVIARAGRISVKKEVPVSAIFESDNVEPDLFYKGRFDFVIFERDYDRRERPVLAIELDGKEHAERETVMRRDKQKNEICKRHRLSLVRVDNTYARRYHYIKEILERFFARR